MGHAGCKVHPAYSDGGDGAERGRGRAPSRRGAGGGVPARESSMRSGYQPHPAICQPTLAEMPPNQLRGRGDDQTATTTSRNNVESAAQDHGGDQVALTK